MMLFRFVRIVTIVTQCNAGIFENERSKNYSYTSVNVPKLLSVNSWKIIVRLDIVKGNKML